MHIGLEAEGRLKGVPTLNLTAEEFASGEYKSVTAYYANIYITDLENVLDLEKINAETDLYNDPILSIERTKVDRQYENITIIFFVDVPVFNLKDTDQIKLHDGQYVWMAAMECMHKSNPSHFQGDFVV